MKKYAVEWTDYCGNAHRKEYKTIEKKMKKDSAFAEMVSAVTDISESGV